jgi:hypothetical protein
LTLTAGKFYIKDGVYNRAKYHFYIIFKFNLSFLMSADNDNTSSVIFCIFKLFYYNFDSSLNIGKFLRDFILIITVPEVLM